MSSRLPVPSDVVICPGIHEPQLTQDFLTALQGNKIAHLSTGSTQKLLIFPTQEYPAYSTLHILQFLQRHASQTTPIVFISFSAGVAGAIGAAWGWEMLGGQVKAFIAFDGWGVPLQGKFPIHRVSHDYFTHWSSALLGTGEDSFYADPAIEHLDLWRSPDSCQGWWVQRIAAEKTEQRLYTTAAQFVNYLLHLYK
ncbi:hypothetical protein [Allocoleopsis sp.]|uniref:hypothetical protein n=1 Tax=Allocoleopsis sp. TaxID=3088169 RepID=UPI002FD10715